MRDILHYEPIVKCEVVKGVKSLIDLPLTTHHVMGAALILMIEYQIFIGWSQHHFSCSLRYRISKSLVTGTRSLWMSLPQRSTQSELNLKICYFHNRLH